MEVKQPRYSPSQCIWTETSCKEKQEESKVISTVELSGEILDELEIIITSGNSGQMRDLSYSSSSSTSSLPSHTTPVQRSSSLQDIGQAADLEDTGENLCEEIITECNVIHVETSKPSDQFLPT